jgi:hypothetical protein
MHTPRSLYTITIAYDQHPKSEPWHSETHAENRRTRSVNGLTRDLSPRPRWQAFVLHSFSYSPSSLLNTTLLQPRVVRLRAEAFLSTR